MQSSMQNEVQNETIIVMDLVHNKHTGDMIHGGRKINIRFELLDLVQRVALVPLLAGPPQGETLLLQLLADGTRAAAALHVVTAGHALHGEHVLALATRVALTGGHLLMLAMVLEQLLLMKHRRLMLMLPIHQVLHCTAC
jgi:hypothetical protein